MKKSDTIIKLVMRIGLAAWFCLAMFFFISESAERPANSGKAKVVKPAVSWNEKIWMDHQGDTRKNWEGQVFHLGNSYFGASCYGGIVKEIFTMSEKSFWLNGPGDKTTNTYGIIPVEERSLIKKIRTLTSEGNFHEVDQVMSRVQRSSEEALGGLSSIGTLELDFAGHNQGVTGYSRTLNLHDSRVDIDYKIGDTRYKREYFCSYPDRVLGIRLTSRGSGKLNFKLSMNLLHRNIPARINIYPGKGIYELDGKMNGNNRPYRVKIKVQNNDGTIRKNGSSLEIKDSSEVVIYYTVATNYKMAPPLFKGQDEVAVANAVITSVEKSNFDAVYEKHLKDYQNLYLRTALHLKNNIGTTRISLPTDERLNYYITKQDYADLGLKELAFNFGKYILLSASRPGTLPAGLQGAWNNRYAAQWNGTYQLDMNVTQTYMFGNALNLPECQEPFLALIKERAEIGKLFAKEYFDCEGWTSFMVTDIWGGAGLLSEPCYKFISTGWLAQILWEQYDFERNAAYLKDIYPVLKGAAEFYYNNLVEYKDTQKLVFAGGESAEHRSPLGVAAANFQDLTFVRETFQNTIKAAEILGVDEEFRKTIATAEGRLMPYKIGRWGQFQEWVEDVDAPRCQHRHLSHLLALQPFKQINPHTMPELTNAIKISLEHRGDADFDALYGRKGNNADTPTQCIHEGSPYDRFTSQVWCRAARLCTWLRLFDGNRADKILQ